MQLIINGKPRSFDETSIDIIIAETFPEEGLGRANNDRLRRASTK